MAVVASILKAVSKSELQFCTFAIISGGAYATFHQRQWRSGKPLTSNLAQERPFPSNGIRDLSCWPSSYGASFRASAKPWDGTRHERTW